VSGTAMDSLARRDKDGSKYSKKGVDMFDL